VSVVTVDPVTAVANVNETDWVEVDKRLT